MSRWRDDEIVDIDFPFFHVHVGGRGRRRSRLGNDDEEVIDMERNESDEYWAVRRRVRARLRFFRHLFTYVSLNSIFVLLDWWTGGPGTRGHWAPWVALIRGIFLGWEVVSNFVAPYLWGREAEERLIERDLRGRRGA